MIISCLHIVRHKPGCISALSQQLLAHSIKEKIMTGNIYT